MAATVKAVTEHGYTREGALWSQGQPQETSMSKRACLAQEFLDNMQLPEGGMDYRTNSRQCSLKVAKGGGLRKDVPKYLTVPTRQVSATHGRRGQGRARNVISRSPP